MDIALDIALVICAIVVVVREERKKRSGLYIENWKGRKRNE